MDEEEVLSQWLRNNGLERFERKLIDHGYDILDDMLTLELDDLLAIGISLEESQPLIEASERYKKDSSVYSIYDVANIFEESSPVKSSQSSEPADDDHLSASQGVYENWIPPKLRPAYLNGSKETKTEVYQNMFLDSTASGGPEFTVVDKITRASVPLPEECARYILVDPLNLPGLLSDEDKEAADKRTSVLNTLMGDAISTTVLHQLIDFLTQQEADEVRTVERTYMRRMERVQAIIDMKEDDQFRLGNSTQIAAFSRYYHGTIAREESESRLKLSGGHPGNFLIRKKSENSMYVFSLCCEGGEIKHFLLERAMKTDGRPGRHFILNKFARLQSCHSVFDVLEELVKPFSQRLPELQSIPPQFIAGVLKKGFRRDPLS